MVLPLEACTGLSLCGARDNWCLTCGVRVFSRHDGGCGGDGGGAAAAAASAAISWICGELARRYRPTHQWSIVPIIRKIARCGKRLLGVVLRGSQRGKRASVPGVSMYSILWPSPHGNACVLFENGRKKLGEFRKRRNARFVGARFEGHDELRSCSKTAW